MYQLLLLLFFAFRYQPAKPERRLGDRLFLVAWVPHHHQNIVRYLPDAVSHLLLQRWQNAVATVFRVLASRYRK